FTFDAIDDVQSQRHEDQRLFLLRKKIPEVVTEENDVVQPLKVISDFVRELVQKTSPDIYNIAVDGLNEAEDGLYVAYTTDPNPDRIQEFKNRVTKLMRGGIEATAGEFAIRTKANL